MDRAEAICYLSPIAESATLPRYKEALDMAIAALREQDATDKNDGRKINADRIRAMTDEELARFLRWDVCVMVRGDNRACHGDCEDCVLDWLQQPVGGAER